MPNKFTRELKDALLEAAGEVGEIEEVPDMCWFESSMPSQPVRSLPCYIWAFSNSGRGVKLSMMIAIAASVPTPSAAPKQHPPIVSA